MTGNLSLKLKLKINFIYLLLKIKLIQITLENILQINQDNYKKKCLNQKNEIYQLILSISNNLKVIFLFHCPHLKKKISLLKEKKKNF